MTWGFFSACLGDLSKYRRMAFFFLKYLFISEMLTFFCFAGWFSDDVIWCATKNGEVLSGRYLWEYWGGVL